MPLPPPMIMMLLWGLCAAGCPEGRYNGNAPAEVVGNDAGLVVRTVEGELWATTGEPPPAVEGARAVALRGSRRGFAAVYRPAAAGGDAVVAWGDGAGDAAGAMAAYRDDSPEVLALHASGSGFAALLSLALPPEAAELQPSPPRRQRVISWGAAAAGLPARLASAQQVESLHAATGGFAAVLPGGEVVTWGHCDTAGEAPPLGGVPERHRPLTALAWAEAFCAGEPLAASQLLAMGGAAALLPAWAPPLQAPMAAVAVTPQGGFWGWATDSVLRPPEEVAGLRYKGPLAATGRAFAAITEAGGVVAWGDPAKGGALPGWVRVGGRASRLRASLGAFAVLTLDGGVAIWGEASHGAGLQLAEGVVDVTAAETGFALLLRNATVLVVGGPAALRETWWLHDVARVEAGGGDSFLAELRGGRLVAWGAQRGGLAPRCLGCAPGTRSGADATGCEACRGGYWSEAGSARCRPCVLGICERHILGGILGLAALLLLFCAVCLCDVAQEEGY